MSTELILAGNGPGELSGWIAPVARAARALDASLRLTLALSPSQFATGREPAVAAAWELFDRVWDPSTCLRLALGVERLPVERPAVLVHLGGELWLSGRLARRLAVPACALAETTLVARRHRAFDRIFAVSAPVAARLTAGGVPAEKIAVTGDPRTDAVLLRVGTDHHGADDHRHRIVSFLPGSRSAVFRELVPFFLRVAGELVASVPELRVQMIVSEFLPPAVVHAQQAASQQRRPDLGVAWVTTEAWAHLARSDFVVTIPGTSTAELAIAAIPFGVVVPLDLLGLASLEGPLEWIARLPGVGPTVKRLALRHYLRSHGFIALPNQWAGKAVVPEWIGRLSPEDVAHRAGELLGHPERLAQMAVELRRFARATPGAAERIAREALAVAGRTPT